MKYKKTKHFDITKGEKKKKKTSQKKIVLKWIFKTTDFQVFLLVDRTKESKQYCLKDI